MRVWSLRLRGLSAHHCARATQLLSKKSRSGGQPLAIVCLILSFGPLEIWTSDLPLQQRTHYRSTNWPVMFHLIQAATSNMQPKQLARWVNSKVDSLTHHWIKPRPAVLGAGARTTSLVSDLHLTTAGVEKYRFEHELQRFRPFFNVFQCRFTATYYRRMGECCLNRCENRVVTCLLLVLAQSPLEPCRSVITILLRFIAMTECYTKLMRIWPRYCFWAWNNAFNKLYACRIAGWNYILLNLENPGINFLV